MQILIIQDLFNLFAKGGVVAGDVTVPTKVVLLLRSLVQLTLSKKYLIIN